ncbi:MAG: DUF1540 domain-containing protein [Clostridia bacterium]|nr:DUF1540 domain-containing protein [Clostridia bacterium]MBQ9189896.1 DUF1540 domain-containing protein [Clostridia bacterium]MBR3271819.1 DUF1540 domain-containing protein [Clostridia bacterium]
MAYGQQSIGCEVHSCLFHQQGNTCRLNSITVRPTPGCTTCGAQDESFCGSYAHRSDS